MISQILLCQGNQGKQLLQQNQYQIRLYQLPVIKKSSIISNFIQSTNPATQPINLITKSRNFYVDIMLQKDYQLVGQQNTRMEQILKDKIRLPLELLVVERDEDFNVLEEEVQAKCFNVLGKVGQGTFAEVFLAEHKFDKALVTIKSINKSEHLKIGTKQMMINEFNVLKYRHFHKINLLYMFQSSSHLHFVTEYCPGGDLYKLIQSQAQLKQSSQTCSQCQILTPCDKYWIFLQVCLFITHLHQKNLIYRDLKPENILIDERGFIKICDFGSVIQVKQGQKQRDICGTLEYIPSQIVLGQEYDKAVDLYALGILLYQLVKGKTPFQGITLQNMKQKKTANIFFDQKVFTMQEKDLIECLTKKKPQQRLGYTNSLFIFKHPFFDNEQVLQLLRDITKRKVNGEFLMKLKFEKPKFLQKRKQQVIIDFKQKYFQSSYNYLVPTFDIDEKIGPKFNSSY